jgi:hypothetical protein
VGSVQHVFHHVVIKIRQDALCVPYTVIAVTDLDLLLKNIVYNSVGIGVRNICMKIISVTMEWNTETERVKDIFNEYFIKLFFSCLI